MENFKLALYEKATKKLYKGKDIVNVNLGLLWSILISKMKEWFKKIIENSRIEKHSERCSL